MAILPTFDAIRRLEAAGYAVAFKPGDSFLTVRRHNKGFTAKVETPVDERTVKALEKKGTSK